MIAIRTIARVTDRDDTDAPHVGELLVERRM
jgi:hypothetical protein